MPSHFSVVHHPPTLPPTLQPTPHPPTHPPHPMLPHSTPCHSTTHPIPPQTYPIPVSVPIPPQSQPTTGPPPHTPTPFPCLVERVSGVVLSPKISAKLHADLHPSRRGLIGMQSDGMLVCGPLRLLVCGAPDCKVLPTHRSTRRWPMWSTLSCSSLYCSVPERSTYVTHYAPNCHDNAPGETAPQYPADRRRHGSLHPRGPASPVAPAAHHRAGLLSLVCDQTDPAGWP